MENKEQKETEQLNSELLKTKVELYQKLSEETGDFGGEPIFDKVWLKKHILVKNK
jgi:hypothetical protein